MSEDVPTFKTRAKSPTLIGIKTLFVERPVPWDGAVGRTMGLLVFLIIFKYPRIFQMNPIFSV